MSDTQNLSLGSEFEPASYEAWRAMAEKSLNGKPFEKALHTRLLEGIETRPIYTADSVQAPVSVDGRAGPWDLRQLQEHPDPKEANRQMLDDLERGASSVTLRVAESERRGVAISGLEDLKVALDGIYLDGATVAIEAGDRAAEISGWLENIWQERGLDKSAVLGELGFDPLGTLARTGQLSASIDESLSAMAATAKHMSETAPNVKTVRVDSAASHAAGADEATDLACLMSTGVAYLRAMEAAGMSVEAAASQMVFSTPLDVDVFLSIAKMRAARLLWSRILEASGVAEEARSMTLYAETAARSVSERDAWVNMLRATTSVFAGAVGGANGLTVLPYTHNLGLPDGFARRMARNTQLILAEESHLAQVADPAAGSWYVDSLTRELGEKAWAKFQKIEGLGGMAAALTSGEISKMSAESWAVRERLIAGRRMELTGSSAFANLEEAPVDVVEAEFVAPDPRPAAVTITPLPAHRLAESFEALRDASDAVLNERGSRPTATIITLGSEAAFAPRLTFTKNYLAAGGIAAHVMSEAELPSDLAGRLVLLCSSDKLYEEHATRLAGELKEKGAKALYLAGRGGEREADYREAGMDGFIYVGDQTLDRLKTFHSLLGL